MHPSPTRGFIWLFLALCAGGLGLLLFGAEYLWVESSEGRVAEVVWAERPGKRMCSPVFEYEVDGKQYRVARDVQESACGWSEGDELTIYYRKSAPGKGYALTFFGLLPAIVGAVIALLLIRASYRGFRGRPFSLAQRLSTVPIVKLADAPSGVVVGVRGTLTPRKHGFTAPMTGRECLAWQLRITRWVGGTEPVLVRNDSSVKQLEMDADGETVVAEEGQAVKVILDRDERGRTKDAASPKLEAHLRSKGATEKGADTSKLDYEWEEGIIEAGGEATIYAIVERMPDGYVLRPPVGGEIVVVTEDLSKHKPEAGVAAAGASSA